MTRTFFKKLPKKPTGYYIVAYDDTGRVIFKSQAHHVTFDLAIRAAKALMKDRYIGRRVESYTVIKQQPRRNPETVATLTATPVAAVRTNTTGKYATPKPKEGSIGAIFNRDGSNTWGYYHVTHGVAVKISEKDFHNSRKQHTVNAPIYVED